MNTRDGVGCNSKNKHPMGVLPLLVAVQYFFGDIVYRLRCSSRLSNLMVISIQNFSLIIKKIVNLNILHKCRYF